MQPRDTWQPFEQRPSAGRQAVLGRPASVRMDSAPAGAQKPRGWPADRWLFLAFFVVAFILFCGTAPGRIVFDTKLGVDIAAKDFLVRLWSLWNPNEWFGSLQDQYIGYAIPMAPFFLAGQLLHVPIWLIERAWLALLVAVGFAGLLKLARALHIGSDGSRLVAAVLFALWPTFTIELGGTSAGALPGLVVPWAVLPLVTAGRQHGTQGRAAARSGLAIAAMAGVNAVSTLAVLALPALYILTHTSGIQRRKLGLKWAIAVITATLWWVIPLLMQGRYSFNFLPYIEQAATTARTMSGAAVLRGMGTWTAYFNDGLPWLRAGWVLATSTAAILASAVAAAVGLAGLARRDMPDRRWLCLCAGLAASIALAGYYGPLGGLLHGPVNSLLDGPLAPFRSLYKIEPVLAVALALGAAHAIDRYGQRTFRVGSWVTVTGAAGSAPVVALVLAGLALPQLTGQLIQQGSFSSVPHYWSQAAAYLAAHSPLQTALVVPADPHGQFMWGTTDDDPLEPLASSPWAENGLVPYGGAGSQILLQTAEQAVESGQQVPGLVPYLARAGIHYVLVRNDVSPSAARYVAPQVVNETLALSGFQRVAAFGPAVPAAPSYPGVAGLVPGFAVSYPSVEIFAPDHPALQPTGPVTALSTSQTVLVNGGPDALLQLTGDGMLGVQPAVIAGDKLAGAPALWAVTDGQRRADDDFALTGNNQSYTYTATGTNPPDNPLGGGGGPPRQLLPVPAAGHQTVAVLSGARSVTASSAGTWLGESQLYDPVNAFDDNPATSWAESDPTTPVGQWIQINFDTAIDLPARVSIRLLTDTMVRSVANELRVTTAAGSAVTDTVDTETAQPLNVRPGRSGWLRITITGASNVRAGYPGAGISDVLIPGVKVASYLQPAEDPAGMHAPAVSYSFSAQAPSPYQGASASQPAGQALNRIFTTPAATEVGATISALPVPGTALQSLITRLTPVRPDSVQVTASSSWNSMPALGPDHLLTGTGPPWLAAAGDSQPQLTITWTRRRTISELVLHDDNGLATAPTGVLVGSPNGARLVTVGLGGVVRLNPPLRTRTLYLLFSARSSSVAGNPSAGQPTQLPIGLSRITIPALAGLHPAVPSATSTFRLGCGHGPQISVGGRSYQTSVTGTVGDLLRLSPVHVLLCSPGGQLALAAGRQRLTVASSKVFTVTSLALTSPHPAAAMTKTRSRQLRVLSWQADSRILRIGSGGTAYVEVHENFNSGWRATLDGRPLTAARLDGWQQAFVVPAGRGGTISLTFAPVTTYHVGIIVSAVALLALLATAMGVTWRRRERPGQPQGSTPALATRGFPVLTADAPSLAPGNPSVVAASSPGHGYGHGGRHRRHRGAATPQPAPAQPITAVLLSRAALVLMPLIAVVLLAGGPIAVAVPVLAVAGARWPTWLPGIAAAAMVLAGVAAAATGTPTVLGSGPFSGAAQVFALVALTAALMPAETGSKERGTS